MAEAEGVHMGEQKIKHEFWSWLENQGYTVYGEVPIAKPLFKSTFQIKDKGEMIEKHTKKYIYVDLVAVKNQRYIGYEFKGSFEAVVQSMEQLKNFTTTKSLDELYLVVPHEILERVKSSYGQTLQEIGVGLIGYSLTGHEVYVRYRSKQFIRENIPPLTYNEASLIHELYSFYTRQGWDVEVEGILPDPQKMSGERGNITQFYKKIDLVCFPKNKLAIDVYCNKEELIGIEVKFGVKKDAINGIIEQLNTYAQSGSLTRVYLAISPRDLKYVQKFAGQQFGVLYVPSSGNVEELWSAPRLNIRFDIFGYVSAPVNYPQINLCHVGKEMGNPFAILPYCGKLSEDMDAIEHTLREMNLWRTRQRARIIEGVYYVRLNAKGRYVVEKQPLP
ncbi:MAG: hypothetical protein QXO16_03895 [Archaeoglobaceae archaeon]